MIGLASGEDLKSIALLRAKSVDEKTISAGSPESLELKLAGEEADGWRILRRNQRSIRLGRDKPIDRQLEDDVWSLLYRTGPKGVSLAELGGLAEKAKVSYRLVFRKPGQPVPTLAVVHWRLGHYATIVGQSRGRYHIEDAAFPSSGLWVTQGALDAEASGYFLVPADTPLEAGWREVGAKEAGDVWGKGQTGGTPPGGKGPPADPPPCPDKGMCGYNIDEATVGLTLSDTPIRLARTLTPKVICTRTLAMIPSTTLTH